MSSTTQLHNSNVIERTSGYSDEMMYRACKTTHDIVFKTEDVKVGRGKNSKVIQRRKYNFTEDIETRTIESLKYYKDRMKRESKIKYRDYQKKIIVQGAEVVLLNRFLYLAMEVRTVRP